MTASRPGIVWYRDDLRVSDHPALHAASNTHASVVCICVLDDRTPGIRPLAAYATIRGNQDFAGARRLTSSTAAAQAIMPAIAMASSRSPNSTYAISAVTAGTR